MTTSLFSRLPSGATHRASVLKKCAGGLLAVLAAGALSSPAEAALASYRNAVLADGAIAYYEFEETSGAVAADSAGGDNNGTFVGGFGLNQPSGNVGLGRSVSFNGSTAAVRIPDNAIFDLGAGAYSVEMWYQTDTTARGDLFTYKGGGGDFGLHSGSQTAHAVSLYHNNFRTNPAATVAGGWNHLVATRTGTGDLSIYINGTLSQTGTATDSLTITNDLLIGSNHNGDPSSLAIPFLGRIDEVAIYASALSAGQVQNHFNLAAVPEPGTAVLALMAGVAVAGARRRRL